MSTPDQGLPIIDAHHHLWDYDNNRYPWLQDGYRDLWLGDYRSLRRNYLIGDYLADCAGNNVVKAVHIQAQWDHDDPVGETRWLQACADEHGYPHGIVAYADLSHPEVESVLREHRRHRNVKGVRMDLNWHQDPYYRFCERPDYMSDERWLAGFASLERYQLSFDLQVYAAYQWEQALALLGRFPAVQCILDNSGLPMDPSPEGRAAWRRGMRALASAPNLAVKLSGLGMFDHQWTTDRIRPTVLEIIELFGPDRCLFASGFPVEGLYGSFAHLVEAYQDILSELPLAHQRKIFHDNALRLYRLG
ncbi:amidohydrolase family protein [Haliangium sp.]|uniref:amidohydrolase family protein n=1 Tax=Haliangium sp. TaxID=2663208 RepID=UPI003D0E6F0B